MSWFAAYSFGKWSGGSLPTYEEWCKAGFWNPKARKRTVYSWGNNGNVLHNRDQAKAFPTGSFPGDVSFYGVRNMTGAPTEWIDRWDGERFTVGMGYYFRGDRGQSFNIASSHDVCGFRIVLRKLRLAASLSDPEKKRLSALVAKLGAAQYSERNETQKQLAAAGPLVQAVLAQHMDSPDPEIRIRVGQILAQARLIQLRLTITITPDGRTMGAWAPVPGAENNPESM